MSTSSNLPAILAFLASFVEQAKAMGLNVSLTEFLGSDGLEAVKEKVLNLLIEHSTEQRRQLEALRTTVQELQASRASPPPTPAVAPTSESTIPRVVPEAAAAAPPESMIPKVNPVPVAKGKGKAPAAAATKPPSFADLASKPLSEEAIAEQAELARRQKEEEDSRARAALVKEAKRTELKRVATKPTVVRRLFTKKTNVFDFIEENKDNSDAEFEVSKLFSKLHLLSKLGASKEGDDIILCDEHPTNSHLRNPKLRELTYPIFVKDSERVRFFEKEGRVATHGPSAGKTIYWYKPTREGLMHFREVSRTHSEWTDMLTFGLLNELLAIDSDDAASNASY